MNQSSNEPNTILHHYKPNFKFKLIFALDCLRKDFNDNFIKRNLSCTLPYIQSMRGILNYSEEENPTCNKDNFDPVENFGWDFAIKASSFRNLNCMGMLLIDVYHET